jgi:hypothetical protein
MLARRCRRRPGAFEWATARTLIAGAKLLELAVLRLYPRINLAELHGRVEIVLAIAALLWSMLWVWRDYEGHGS